MRAVGNALVNAACFITFHLYIVTSVVIHMMAMSISVPHFIEAKAWEVVIMMSIFMSIGPGRLLQQWFFGD